MLQLMQLKGYQIHSSTGELGVASDFLFDDRDWIVRYVVVDTGGWLTSRQVHISPQAIVRADHSQGEMHLGLSKEQIEISPAIQVGQALTRERESALASYYGWPEYWAAVIEQTAAAGPPHVPPYRATGLKDRPTMALAELRSIKEMTSFALEAADGTIGEVEDFLADRDDWTIRYILVDTGRWLPGRKVLISPSWTESTDWIAGRVHVGLTKEGVQSSPAYDPSQTMDREYETELHEHYGKARYWLAGKHDVPVRIG
jgi:hypothetical protein